MKRLARPLGVPLVLLLAACTSIVGFPDVPGLEDGGADDGREMDSGPGPGADSGPGNGVDGSGMDTGPSPGVDGSGTDSGPSPGVDGGATDSGSSVGADSAQDSPSEVGAEAGGCSPGATKCASASAAAMCGANGVWSSPWTCATGTCSGNACTGSTASGTSCQTSGKGLTNCGSSSESCCASLEVAGGTYSRTYTNLGNGPTREADPASVSGFRMDKYEVTVGRFRQFVNAWNGGAGYTPLAESGKHAHLNATLGLADSSNAGSYEPGWILSDDANIMATTSNLACDPSFSTWTATAGGNENLPINCVDWTEAYAFCIWDGGFLPSESEEEYVEAGGSQEREYPWGTTPPGTGNQYAIQSDDGSNCDYPSVESCVSTANIAPVGTATKGAGLWGQLDLEGSVFEWTLDWFDDYVVPCIDCADLQTGTLTSNLRIIRDNAFFDAVPPTTMRAEAETADRFYSLGLRCARTP